MKFLKWILSVSAAFILSINICYAYDRVIILSPAAADIFIKLGLNDKVVGVTKHVNGFENAIKVGSHLKPNLELILSLKPDFIIYSNNKFISDYLKSLENIKTYEYDPTNVNEIFENIKTIASIMNVSEKGEALINQLKHKLTNLKEPKRTAKVIYEITQAPYIVAGKNSVISDIIEKAGGINIINIDKKLIKFSVEKTISLKPDIYIYQIGPMNKNPTPPKDRIGFKDMDSVFIQVNELTFSRANTKTIDAILYLNNIFYKWSLQ
ncbi:ABC transporter substrate-binding protein [Deferribacteraceae bacterium V6Fe1]|nr:ABC transporter substrate-binding protein [Deferribacteraceae bacterium V6Fe1]